MAARIGILGGTFDPIHIGHLEAADAARAAVGLDRILLVAASAPPHRPVQPVASPFHRFAMIALAAMAREDAAASDLELRRPEPSYTSRTLQQLAESGSPPAQLFFICGADAFAEIATWHDYPAVLDRANFVVVSRPGHPAGTLADRLPALADRMVPPARTRERPGRPAIVLIDALTSAVSSSAIRRRIAAGAPVADLLSPEVARYIQRHGLYSPEGRRAGGLHDE